jgi:hypothetical protein
VALAVEPTEKIDGGALPFLRVAFEAGGDEVAVGIAPELHARHDMVEAAQAASEPTQAVKTEATLARMDDLAELLGLQEIGLLEVGGLSLLPF